MKERIALMVGEKRARRLYMGTFHSVFIRPFVLVGVLRNYIQSGINDIPTEESFAVLDGKSEKFRKLHQEAA